MQPFKKFSHQGNEVAFGSIGDAATSEGQFFETINAAGVLQVPMFVSVWDDAYGISVPAAYHTTKKSIAKALAGLQRTKEAPGYEIFTVKGSDYLSLCTTYRQAAEICRKEHVPVLMHVQEMTQPQGHSTSGSHTRYKSATRLAWEKAHDCIQKMRAWILEAQLATAEQLDAIEKIAQNKAKVAKNAAWKAFGKDIAKEQHHATHFLQAVAATSQHKAPIKKIIHTLHHTHHPTRLHALQAVKDALRVLHHQKTPAKKKLISWLQKAEKENYERFSSHLHSLDNTATGHVPGVKPIITKKSHWVDGREIIQACFNALLKRDARVFAIGQDIGQLGDVNQGMAGLQEKYGPLRVTDTGIRECTMVGQGIGAAMRGLRPIVEIQYLDYVPYALQIMMDDLATLHYRTKGGQKAPVIIRTRGHRLEGIWHSGSYLGGIIHNVRGMYVLVPRNMTQAAGFYNTLLQGNDPALLIECLNGYRRKEQMPDNIDTCTVPLGRPEILRPGTDVTVVTYGAMCQMVMQAAETLQKFNISCEVIDVQTLLPFDCQHSIVASVQKTNRIVFADEDVPGGTTAYLMQQVLEVQKAYDYLDASPITITSQPHRPAYADDGDYFSKPNAATIFDKIYALMSIGAPTQYPELYTL